MSWSHRTLPFPQNLTAGQLRCIEAIRRHGTRPAAALSMGLSVETMDSHLEKARRRAGTHTTAELIEKLAAFRSALARASQPQGEQA